MRYLTLIVLVVVFVIFSVPQLLFAYASGLGDPELEQYLNMSLEELLSMDVSSTTKSEVSIQKAPGVIRVFTSADIEKYGFNTLKEVLANIPGIQIEEYRAGHQLIWVRGVQARYNNKVLLMIDGVPIRDSYYGNFNIDEMLPLNVVDRIEVINGPGSVLYGTNSLSGVISITTKSKGSETQFSAGSYAKKSGSIQASTGGFYGYADYFKTDGFVPPLNMDGAVWDHPQEATRSYGLAKFKSKSFTVIGSYGNYNYPYKYRKSQSDYSQTRKPLYVTAMYSGATGENGSFSAQGYYSQYGFTRHKTKYEDDLSISSVKDEILDIPLYGIDLSYSMNTGKHSAIFGFSYQEDKADDGIIVVDKLDGTEEPNLIVSNITRSDMGWFFQDVWDITPYMSLTSGIRYDHLSEFDNEFNYRIGLTGMTENNVYGKILYGTAYRVPSYREYLDVSSYNESLHPERLKTFEVQAGILFSNGDVNATIYHNSYTNFIKELDVFTFATRDIDDEFAINANSRTITGMELNSIIYPSDKLSLNMSAGIIFSAKETIGNIDTVSTFVLNESIVFEPTDLTYLSAFTFNILTSYDISSLFSASVNAHFYSNRKTPLDYQTDVPVENQNSANAKGYTKFDLFMKSRLAQDVTFNLKISNLFDSRFYSQPYGGDTGYDVEWPGREVQAGFSYSL